MPRDINKRLESYEKRLDKAPRAYYDLSIDEIKELYRMTNAKATDESYHLLVYAFMFGFEEGYRIGNKKGKEKKKEL